jgi:hypothetical protein
LRPGTVHASRFVVLVLRCLIRLLRARWPHVTIELYRFRAIAARTLREERENDETMGGGDEPVTRPDPLAGNGRGAV